MAKFVSQFLLRTNFHNKPSAHGIRSYTTFSQPSASSHGMRAAMASMRDTMRSANGWSSSWLSVSDFLLTSLSRSSSSSSLPKMSTWELEVGLFRLHSQQAACNGHHGMHDGMVQTLIRECFFLASNTYV